MIEGKQYSVFAIPDKPGSVVASDPSGANVSARALASRALVFQSLPFDLPVPPINRSIVVILLLQTPTFAPGEGVPGIWLKRVVDGAVQCSLAPAFGVA
eukprot:SAG31_NODE_1367_length_8615_cov_12.875763_5_plen_99_part_00